MFVYVAKTGVAVAVALASLAATSCQTSSDDRDDRPTADASTREEASVAGPLAVVDYGTAGGSLASGGTGVLRITDNCVSIDRDGGSKVLPVWHEVNTEWDGSAGTILFAHPDGSIVELNDGDTITLTGEALFGDEESEAEKDIPWVQEPASGCDGDPFIVDDVTTG